MRGIEKHIHTQMEHWCGLFLDPVHGTINTGRDNQTIVERNCRYSWIPGA